MIEADSNELQAIYAKRFEGELEYRNRVWAVLCHWFWERYVPDNASVLDLGCGYGQFINHIRCGKKWAMDLNPESRRCLHPDVAFLEQDCSAQWPLPDASLDVVFTSNFFEHLPDKTCLKNTLLQAKRCLKPGGSLIAMGPNIKCVPGAYWDFWDHYLPLTEASLAEGLRTCGMHPVLVLPQFLPYTMVKGPRYPMWFLQLYLKLPVLWRIFGSQFLVIARK